MSNMNPWKHFDFFIILEGKDSIENYRLGSTLKKIVLYLDDLTHSQALNYLLDYSSDCQCRIVSRGALSKLQIIICENFGMYSGTP